MNAPSPIAVYLGFGTVCAIQFAVTIYRHDRSIVRTRRFWTHTLVLPILWPRYVAGIVREIQPPAFDGGMPMTWAGWRAVIWCRIRGWFVRPADIEDRCIDGGFVHDAMHCPRKATHGLWCKRHDPPTFNDDDPLPDESPTEDERPTYCTTCGGTGGWYCTNPTHTHAPTRRVYFEPGAEADRWSDEPMTVNEMAETMQRINDEPAPAEVWLLTDYLTHSILSAHPTAEAAMEAASTPAAEWMVRNPNAWLLSQPQRVLTVTRHEIEGPR